MADDKEKKDALASRRAPRAFSLLPESLGEAREIATLIAGSDFAPKDYKGKPGNVIIAIQMGADVGLKPMQALQNIAVINGKPSIYGDGALALVLGAEILEDFSEFYEGKEGTDEFTAVCVAKRKGMSTPVRRTFSVGDAKAAGLWGKQGPWTQYWKRMLLFRARGFGLRDVASDVLMGLILAEEAQDYPEVIDITPDPSALPPAVSALERLSDGLRESIEKAFETLALAPGLRLTKLTEYLGVAEGTDDEKGQALLDWCRDEFARRKTGQPRKAKADNGKTVQAPTGASPASDEPRVDPSAGASGDRPSGAEALGGTAHPPDSKTPTAEEIFKGQPSVQTAPETAKQALGF